jgi:hypothetical protein
MRYILTLLLGAILGGVLVFYLLAGMPGAKRVPGSPMRAPEQGADPPGTVVISLDESFFDTFLGTIFRDLGSPSFRLAKQNSQAEPAPLYRFAVFQASCENAVVLTAEGSNNTKTGVQFRDGKVMAPLAFNASYNAPAFGCLKFKGTALANIQLSFDRDKQTVYGQISVEGVSLDGVNPLASAVLQVFVQNAINEKVNPLEIIKPQQLALAIPVQASRGTVKGQVKDVRSEIKDGMLRLHISYDFSGGRGQA